MKGISGIWAWLSLLVHLGNRTEVRTIWFRFMHLPFFAPGGSGGSGGRGGIGGFLGSGGTFGFGGNGGSGGVGT